MSSCRGAAAAASWARMNKCYAYVYIYWGIVHKYIYTVYIFIDFSQNKTQNRDLFMFDYGGQLQTSVHLGRNSEKGEGHLEITL